MILKAMTTDPSRIAINDVLLGRGGATNNHEGNKRYRTIVSFHQPEYLIARKKDKALISKRIVAIVKANGGRFLRRDASSRWVEIPDKKAIEKTSQALREGLDVRNHTVRPQKQVRRHLSLNEESTQVIVSGFVVPNAAAPVAPAAESSLHVPVEATRPTMAAAPAATPIGVLVMPQGYTIPVAEGQAAVQMITAANPVKLPTNAMVAPAATLSSVATAPAVTTKQVPDLKDEQSSSQTPRESADV